MDSSEERFGSEDCRVGEVDGSEDCKVVSSMDCRIGEIVGSGDCKIVGSEDCGIGGAGSTHMSMIQRAMFDEHHMLESLMLNMPSGFHALIFTHERPTFFRSRQVIVMSNV